MSRQHIEITQIFNASVGEIFTFLTDHEAFGGIVNAKIKRIVDSPGDLFSDGVEKNPSLFPWKQIWRR